MNKYINLGIVLLFTVQCSHIPQNTMSDRKPNTVSTSTTNINLDWLTELPGDSKEYIEQIRKIVIRNNKTNKLSDSNIKNASERIAKYVSFVMYNYPDSVSKKRVSDDLISRLMQSSVQFILCSDLNDFSCLEKTPILQPTSDFRIEDPKLKLGEVVQIKDSFEKSSEYYFNEQIFATEDQYDPSNGVAKVLENKIKKIGTHSDKDALYMAIYGMDDIQKTENNPGSLSGIYSAIIDRITAGTTVYGVFDQSGPHELATKPLIFSYVKPPAVDLKKWILSPLNNSDTQSKIPANDLTNMDFQYKSGTQGLVLKLSEKIKSDEKARGRIEWPDTDLMHNKFFIFKENKKMSVWTGTANISRTCLGTERNSNLSVVIHNDEVAKSYLTEFNEMYEYKDAKLVKPDLGKVFIGLNKQKYFPRGKFHKAKLPNTKRYFNFLVDQTELRLYFSPTDDAEHRALLPMLLSARPGDQILISMFGGAGIEYARSLQWAASRGVDVQVIVDSPTACGTGSWAGRNGDSSLIEDNPYQKISTQYIPLQIHKNDKNKGETWKQNHQKIGLLIRKKSDGTMSPEYFTFGSQNWSQNGNDKNDENLIILRKKDGPIKMASAFEDHFKNFLWPKSQNIPQTGCTEILLDIPADGK